MPSAALLRPRSSRLTPSSVLFMSLLLIAAGTTGCGSGTARFSNPPKLSGNTSVTVVLSSTANDQLSLFDVELKTLTLTNQSGKTVNLLSSNQPIEAIHVNGEIEPITTLSIPQDVYTSAIATVGSAEFTCVTLTPLNSPGQGGLDISTYAYGYTPDSMVTVNLPSQITVTGASMVLELDMQVLQSATYASCYPSGSYAITPTFNLAALPVASHPSNSANGKAMQVNGQVASIGTQGSDFTLSVSEVGKDVRTVSIRADGNTVYQGITGFTALQVGTFVDMDGAVQADGSLLATRVASYDTSAVNVMTGPVLFTSNALPTFNSFPRQQQGQDYSSQPFGLGIYSSDGATLFKISGQLSNLTNLPFVPTFSNANMVPGQNVAVYSGPVTAFNGGQTTIATTVTLMPQSIDGNIVSSSTSGSFTVYAVQLAADNLFPSLAVQSGQTTLVNNPNLVNVYVDANTQKLNTTALNGGNTLRFYGLVFNDSGTLRMDCARVSDGVAFTAPSNAVRKLQVGQMQTVLRKKNESLPQVITTVTRSH
jgi:Domain of unknown function (DUF5666)